ncbi:MAG: hypothetical protein ACTHN5_13990 [Phycisphaerae bacterium]
MSGLRWMGVVWGMGVIVSVARGAAWEGYAGDGQHTADSLAASQALQTVHWQTAVDLAPQLSGSELLIHYGSPVISAGNTVVVPVKTGATGGFALKAFDGGTGVVKWTAGTDYLLPAESVGATSRWTPSFGPALSGSTLFYAGAGGTIYRRTLVDDVAANVTTLEAFYGGILTYQANAAAYDSGVSICTPITADGAGNVYFGYQTSASAPGGLSSGIARLSAGGVGSFFPASSLMVNGVSAGMTEVATNCAPAVSADGKTVYVAMNTGNFGAGRLVALNAATMLPTASVALVDPKTGGNALVPNDGSASPTIGPDGDVYFGVYDAIGTSRGWLEHFSADLSVQKPTGGFGWDDTASLVPASMVPSYHGTSTYLLMTKYNNYVETGGDGRNMLAIVDPNATEVDTRPNSLGAGGATIMKTVLTISSPTADGDLAATHPGAVTEWCVNTAVVDPATDSILVNNEDGHLYRWDLAANALTESVEITAGIGEAYTPTLMGPDGTVYAINDATLFAVGAVPEPGMAGFFFAAALWMCLKGRRSFLSA